MDRKCNASPLMVARWHSSTRQIFHYNTGRTNLSSEKSLKNAQTSIPNLVKFADLYFLKNKCIITYVR